MLRKGQVERLSKSDAVGQAKFVEDLFGFTPAASIAQQFKIDLLCCAVRRTRNHYLVVKC
jgi:hypothetical protein